MKNLINDSSNIRVGILEILLLLGLLFGLASCQAAPTKPTQPSQSSPGQPAVTPLPAANRSSTTTEDDSSPIPGTDEVLTVVGVPANQTLPLFREPSLDAEILCRVPPTGSSLHPQPAGDGEEPEGWMLVTYQGRSGWADSSHLALQQGDLPDELVALGQYVTAALRSRNYSRLEEIVHPQLCLRFAPYPYLRDTDLIFCPGELAGLLDSNTLYNWGNFDGSGEPIQLTFAEYHDRFVYDQDYFQPDVVGFNQEVSSGNAPNNILEIYPDGIMVEYYFPEIDPQYGGMDWRSLRLVFVNQDGVWYLTALIHGEWTI